jgi:DNA-binding NtrC family response regulator
VGEVKPRLADARIVAATHRDLEADVEDGRFREDLYWRMRVLHLDVPPLRSRHSDIPLLIESFLERAARRTGARRIEIDPAAAAALREHQWPGNVRQLYNVLESALTFASGPRITVDDLPGDIRRSHGSREIVRSAAERGLTLGELERDYIFEVLRRAEGNKSKAAEMLGMPRRTLYRRLQEYAESDAAAEPAHRVVPE